MDLEALAIHVGARKVQGLMESEAQARDSGEVDLVVERGGGGERPADFFHPEDGREPGGGGRANECQSGPVALQNVLREEADAAVAEAHGRGGKAVDVFPVQAIVLEFLCRDAVGGCVVELSQQTDFPDVGCLSPCACATELESRDHVLTQWGHEMSPSRS